MTSKELITTILNRKAAERFGIFEHFWPETIRDYWTKEGFPAKTDQADYFDYDIAHAGGWFDVTSFPGKKEILEQTEEWEIIKNGNGASVKLWRHKSGTPEHIGFEMTGREIWEKTYREPLLALDKNRLDLPGMKQNLEKARKTGKFTVFGNFFIFELMRNTIGDEHFLPAMLLEPGWLKDFCQVYTDFYIRHYEMIFREAGLPDGMFIYEDLGYKNGLFCSPAALKELVTPYHKRLVNYFKDHGLPVILHSCGDVRRALPSILEAGFDCLQPMEAKANMNVLELAKEYSGKIAFMGNIDVTVLNTNNKAAVKQEIEYKLKALKKLKAPYVFHSDHSIPPDVRFETYKYALEVYKANCRL